jgi:hypothetical protein
VSNDDDDIDPMQPAFNTVDRWGRQVFAFHGQWVNHVEARHPEMIGHWQAARETIRTPDLVTMDATYSDREHFYRRGMIPGYSARLYLKVCVGYVPGNFYGTFTSGVVVTAYLTPKIGKGETQKWP